MRLGFWLWAVVLLGCGASDPATPGGPVEEGPSDAAAPDSTEPPATEPAPTQAAPEPPPPAKPLAKPEIVLSGRPIQAFAIGASHVFTLESDVRTRLVATAKAKPHAVKVVLEEDILDGVRFEGVGAARGRVFVVDSYGAMKSALEDGTDPKSEYVPGLPTRILSSAGQTLWLADLPRFLGDSLTFHWLGADPEQVPFAGRQMEPIGAVGDVAVDDEALVYATRGAETTLRSWAPAATGARAGHRLLATLPEEGRGLGLDAGHAYVVLPSAKEIRRVDRTTGASSAVLSGATFDTVPVLRSDGTNLYLLTEGALRRCAIATCGATMEVLASGLANARALALDATHAWIVMTAKGQPGTIARVPR